MTILDPSAYLDASRLVIDGALLSRQPRSKLADPSVNSMPAASSSPAQQPSLTPHEECVAYFRRGKYSIKTRFVINR